MIQRFKLSFLCEVFFFFFSSFVVFFVAIDIPYTLAIQRVVGSNNAKLLHFVFLI